MKNAIESVVIRVIPAVELGQRPFRVLKLELAHKTHWDMAQHQYGATLTVFDPTDDDLKAIIAACLQGIPKESECTEQSTSTPATSPDAA